MLCFMRQRSVRRGDHEFRGVPPSVVFLSVSVKEVPAHNGLLWHGRKIVILIMYYMPVQVAARSKA